MIAVHLVQVILAIASFISFAGACVDFRHDGFSGTIYSDDDNDGPTTGGDCTFDIRCPTGWVIGVSRVHGTLHGNSLLLYDLLSTDPDPANRLIWDVQSTADSYGNPTYIDTNRMLQTSSVRLEYISSGAPGFGLEYKCYYGSCSINMSHHMNDGPAVYTALEGTIRTDPDGSGGTYDSINNEVCRFEIQCPVGWVVGITRVRGSIHANALLIYDLLSTEPDIAERVVWNVQPATDYYGRPIYVDTSRMLQTSSVSFAYPASPGTGVTLSYKCCYHPPET